ncbi:hypothetical protein FJTKL_08386 [Diaporthe vaccinii]|uniref:Uncharacterized protein n=1 Tax=Diaporthe vaccinii TaxID=105482 RepID=A0ABR4ERU5_9PEZI
MASVPTQGQPGQPTQQQQALQARLDDPLVSEDFRGEIRDINDYLTLSALFAAQRKEGHEIAPLSQDPDKNFPDNDPAKQQQLVGRLFEAMRNQIDILDGTVKKDASKQVIRDANGRPVMRDSGFARRMRDEPNVRLEMLAWGLLLGIRDAQLGALYALEWTWNRNFEYQHFDSFMDRFNAVVESINVSILQTIYKICLLVLLLTHLRQVSKKAAADLMEPSWTCRLANAPEHEVQRKKGNMQGNKKKQTLLEEAAAKRKRDREMQEGQEDDEDNHEAASHDTPDTPGTPAIPATPARRSIRKTAPRNARKQPKRSATDTPRRAAAGTQPATGHPPGQSSMLATPQGFTQQTEVAPQMTANNSHPTVDLAPELDNAAQFFGPVNGWTPSVGATAFPSAQPETTSVSFQGPPQGFALHLPDHSQQLFSQNPSDQVFNFTAPIGNPLLPAYGNSNHFLPQANPFGAQFTPEAVPSPGFLPDLGTTPGHISTAPTTPFNPSDTSFSSAPQTPWSSYTPEFNSPQPLGSAPDYQQFASAWDAQMPFRDNENPQGDLV